jgi:Ni,Fe-hydrogenase III large subunit
VVSQLVRWVVRDDLAQRERFMRENLDAMAQRVGEMQARLLTLQMMGERVSQLAGLKPEDLRPRPAVGAAPRPGARRARRAFEHPGAPVQCLDHGAAGVDGSIGGASTPTSSPWSNRG